MECARPPLDALDEASIAAVERMDGDQLERALERILAASRIEDVLDEP